MERTRRGLLAAVGSLAGAALVPARLVAAPSSDGNDDHDRALRDVRRGDRVRMRAVLQRIRKRYPGRVIDAEHLEKEAIYKILWRTDAGRVYQVIVDARIGQIIRVSHRGKVIWRRGDAER